MRGMVKLQVYIRRDCWSCAESRRIIAEIAPQFPQIAIELFDIEASVQPKNVYAVPTYILDGRIIFLGNPFPAELRRKLQAALNHHQV